MRDVKKQVVQDKTQIRLARAVVSQGEGGIAFVYLVDQRLNELVQVVNLLELAARVLVQLAFARQDVQLLEQLNGLAGTQLVNDLWLVFRLFWHQQAV